MTIPVEQTNYVYAGPYSTGDILPIPFSYQEESHVKVQVAGKNLEYNVGYTITGQNITLSTDVASGVNVVVYRETPLDNDSEFPQEAKFPSEKISGAIDKLTMQNQEQDDAIARTVKFSKEVDTTTVSNITFPSPDPGKAIKWSDDNNLENSENDVDTILDEAKVQADLAANQATLAAEQAHMATEESFKSEEYALTSKSWAIGSIDDLEEGSARYWAQRAADAVVNGAVYGESTYIKISDDKIISLKAKTLTQSEWDNLSEEEQKAIGIAFIYEE